MPLPLKERAPAASPLACLCQSTPTVELPDRGVRLTDLTGDSAAPVSDVRASACADGTPMTAIPTNIAMTTLTSRCLVFIRTRVSRAMAH